MQLIQPIYDDVFDLEEETDRLLEHIDDILEARFSLYQPASSYDLTSLGEALLENGRKPERKQVLDKDADDGELLAMVENAEDYWDEDLYDDEYDDEDDEYDDEEDDEYDDEDDEYDESEEDEWEDAGRNTVSAGIKELKPGGSIYSFKVKPLCKKRAAKVIKLKGIQTLDDLSDAVQSEFDLEWDHLYSFFMSNKAWNRKAEYSHPRSDGRPADAARIGRLGLKPKQKFLYLFDYGDELKFEVEVEDIS